jgi:hypothetical protein
VSAAQIEAEYLNKYEVRDNALYLRIKLGVSIPQPPPPSRFIVVPKLPYDVYLYRCDIAGTSCSPVSQGSIYRGEINWLTLPCPSTSCGQEVELPIILDKELIDRLVSIVEGNERPAFQVVLSSDPYAIPHVIASVSLPNANAYAATILNLNVHALIKGNLSGMPQLIVLSSDDVKHILDRVKYFERVKIEVEVKLPETTEGLPEPLIDAVKALKAAFNDINNLDFVNAVIKCRSAMEYITKHEKRGDKDVKVIRDEVRGAILSRYEGVAKDVYTEVLESLEATIRDIYRMMSKFIHPGSNRVGFNPRMVDAIYIFRQTLGIVNYLVELSRA